MVLSRVKDCAGSLLVLVVALLAISVVLQAIIAWKMFQLSPQSASVDVLPVSESQQPIAQRQRPIPVEITNRREIDVNVRNHYILSGDPIPVEIVR